MINKKMMLCGAVGGDVDMYNAMIEVEECKTINCSHFKEASIWNEEIKAWEPEFFTQYETLRLKTLVHKSEEGDIVVGAVVRCPTCGKIYYTEDME